MVELLSILVLTFALTLVVLGLVTIWLERGAGRWQGIAAVLVGLLVGAGYSFLASRFSVALFGHLIVRVNLPALMVTAITYTIGLLSGVLVAVGLFLWVTGRYQEWQIRRRVLAMTLAAIAVVVLLSFLAVRLSR